MIENKDCFYYHYRDMCKELRNLLFGLIIFCDQLLYNTKFKKNG